MTADPGAKYWTGTEPDALEHLRRVLMDWGGLIEDEIGSECEPDCTCSLAAARRFLAEQDA